MSVLLDSDVLIEVLRARDRDIAAEWSALVQSGNQILFSPVTAAEIWAGAHASEFQATSRLFQLLICAPIEHEIGQLAGELLRQFARSHGLKIGDALIAATAIQHRAALWTRNRKHYPMPQLTFF